MHDRHRPVLWLVALAFFCTTPARADNTLHLAEDMRIALPDWLPYVARLEDGQLVRSPSDNKTLPSDAEMNDGKKGKRLLNAYFSTAATEVKLCSFDLKLNFFADSKVPADREQLARKRKETLDDLEAYAKVFDQTFSGTWNDLERLSISARKIGESHTLIDYSFRGRINVSGAGISYVRWITIFGPDGASVMMIDSCGAKQSTWGNDVERILKSISFE